MDPITATSAPNDKASRNLTEALVARHAEIHALLEEIADKVDSVDPDTANWGHVGDLGYIAEKLRHAAGRES